MSQSRCDGERLNTINVSMRASNNMFNADSKINNHMDQYVVLVIRRRLFSGDAGAIKFPAEYAPYKTLG